MLQAGERFWSFLKKRTKKHLFTRNVAPAGKLPNHKGLLASFFSEKEESFLCISLTPAGVE
jgi:hypothetical protein